MESETGNYLMTAKTQFGLEDLLIDELQRLGASQIERHNRAVSFYGDKGFMYKANLSLRTALRFSNRSKHSISSTKKDCTGKSGKSTGKITWV
jgi:23S rRNA G2445 N2-methylase RlmL